MDADTFWKRIGALILVPLAILGTLIWMGSGSTAEAGLFSTPFVLQSAEIDGTNAHLNVLTSTLTFDEATMHGLTIRRQLNNGATLTIHTDQDVTATSVVIHTTIDNYLYTIGDFQVPSDVFLLMLGQTVRHVKLTDVTMNVNGYMDAGTLDFPGLQLLVH